MSIDEFFGENIVSNIASFLNIPTSKIRVAKIVSANQGGRKKRALNDDLGYVTVRNDLSHCILSFR